MGAFHDVISLNCHSSEDNKMTCHMTTTRVLSHHTHVSHLTTSNTHLLHAINDKNFISNMLQVLHDL